jgi:phosphoribosylamine---glycine ligase
MNLLILGSGGREHAFAWKLAQSPLCNKLFIAPGNAGTAQCGTNVPIGVNDFDGIAKLCREESIELVLVGPEEPLVKGIVDYFKGDESLKSIPVIGPSAQGAQLEGSKAFAKKFMTKYKIPTAAYREFNVENYDEGIPYLEHQNLPIVLKADGLAAGKGVMICQSHLEAISEYELMIQQQKFGDAGKTVVVEEFLDGIECSVFVLTDGRSYVVLPEAKDYKRIGVGDTGNNTGGMGAISPVPFADQAFLQKVEEGIIMPTINGLQSEGIDYTGFIFIGLIKVEDEPIVIEYNCRMGDPETEVVIPRLKNDFVELLKATGEKKLDSIKLEVEERSACTIMTVSRGYPGAYEKGFEITGLQTPENGSIIFHAGTDFNDGKVVTNGGRVLTVTSLSDNLQDAVRLSKAALANIDFDGMYYRKDIGYEFEND